MSKANQLIEHWRQRISEKEKEIYMPEEYNGGRPRFNSIVTSDRRRIFERVLNLEERQQIRLHPQLKPKEGKPKEYHRVRSQERLWSDNRRFDDVKPLDEDDIKKMIDMQFGIKIVDMGNGCYIDNQFSDIIQTRQYRSPEVLIRSDYDESADMWSLACTIFELITGDYLFEPKKGKTYKKNEDHMALISELIGPCMNKKFLLSGRKSEVIY